MKNNDWYGVDFDGTLATYDGWGGNPVQPLGEPIPLMVSRVKGWLAHGVNVRILTARVGQHNPYREKHRQEIYEWLVEVFGRDDAIR